MSESGWTQWMFLHLMVSGTCSLVTVHQPPVLTAALGHDVIMPCQFNVSHNDKVVALPSLYWEHLGKDTDNARLWPPSEKYEQRVDLLDKNMDTSNKSILLNSVQWADGGKYLCKLSVVTTESDTRFRTKGDETLLLVYDTMIFNLTGHNDSLLWCEVNVTQDPGFVLSIFHNGSKAQTTDSAPGAAAPPYVTLSETIFLWSGGKYECQLHLNDDLIMKSIFHLHAPAAGQDGDAEKDVSTVSETDEVAFPEPWLLYGALLLVPIIVLLGLSLVVVALLRCRR